MDLSIIIADSNDLRIKKCVESIDEDVEVIVSLNSPTRELVDLVNKLNVKTCLLPQKGLAVALNNGIQQASNEKILIIDSDCVFEKGTIKKLYDALDSYPMVRGVQLTKYNGFISKIISKSREFHGNTNPKPNFDEIKAFKPLAYRKLIIPFLGGSMYVPKLKLSEDFEMNERRKKAGIELLFLSDAIIYHDSIKIKDDLKSAFKYGCDRDTMIKMNLTKQKKPFIQSIKKLKEKCLPRYGLGVTIYMVLWTTFYDLGYHIQKRLNINGV
jgi:GT2 family glycosyltransferase